MWIRHPCGRKIHRRRLSARTPLAVDAGCPMMLSMYSQLSRILQATTHLWKEPSLHWLSAKPSSVVCFTKYFLRIINRSLNLHSPNSITKGAVVETGFTSNMSCSEVSSRYMNNASIQQQPDLGLSMNRSPRQHNK